MNSKNEGAHRFHQSSFFADILEKIIQEYALIGEEKIIPAHNLVFQQGDSADSFYIIDSGSVRVLRKGKEGFETELRRLGPGDSFGEMALLTGDPRAASIETLEETHLLVISKERFYQILRDNPDMSSIFFKKLSNWLVHTDMRIEQAEKELRKSYENLYALSSRIIEIEEAERQRLARELHDQVGQKLTALSINLDLLVEQLSDKLKINIISRLRDSKVLVKETMKLIRNIMADLRPLILDDYGLIGAIHWYNERFSKLTRIPIVFEGEEVNSRLPLDVETNLFRIIQESLTNVAKHAHARKVTITLKEKEKTVKLTITDDGNGFNPENINQEGESTKLGLINMRERAEVLGGKLHVESSPGKGTRVMVEVKV